MKFLKISQSLDLLDERIQSRYAKIYNKFLDTLGGNRYSSGRYFGDYTEFHYEDMGEYYIQVSLQKDTGRIRLEKYYEKEYLQNEWGKIVFVPFDFNDLRKTVDTVRKSIEQLRNRS